MNYSNTFTHKIHHNNNRKESQILPWHLLFPPRCPGCDSLLSFRHYKVGFCDNCMEGISYVSDTVCLHCGSPIKDATKPYCKDCERTVKVYTQGKGVYVYKGIMKSAMYRFKYAGRRDYARTFAKDAYGKYAQWLHAMNIDVILPIPMYYKKERKRGYNQASCFAKALSDISGIPVRTDLLIRDKDTTPLKSLNPSQRKKNLKKAFIFRKNVVQYENTLLVDDIYTTGATMNAAAYVLRRHGIQRVYGMYVCIGQGDS